MVASINVHARPSREHGRDFYYTRPGQMNRELIDVELFLAWRGQGLPVEAPGGRR